MPPWRFRIYRDTRREWRWSLIAANRKVVADSGEGYRTSTGARRAAKRVREMAAKAIIRFEPAARAARRIRAANA